MYCYYIIHIANEESSNCRKMFPSSLTTILPVLKQTEMKKPPVIPTAIIPKISIINYVINEQQILNDVLIMTYIIQKINCIWKFRHVANFNRILLVRLIFYLLLRISIVWS